MKGMNRLIKSIKAMTDEQIMENLENLKFFREIDYETPELKVAYQLLTAELETRNRK